MRSRKQLCVFILVVAGNANCPHADGVPMSLTSECYQVAIPALGIWREAQNQSPRAMRAVAWVIRTRASDPRRWPDDPADVVTQPKQFSAFNRSDPNSTKWPKPGDPSWKEACAAWESHQPDPTNGANHYHSYKLKRNYPKWTRGHEPVAVIDAFKFYRL